MNGKRGDGVVGCWLLWRLGRGFVGRGWVIVSGVWVLELTRFCVVFGVGKVLCELVLVFVCCSWWEEDLFHWKIWLVWLMILLPGGMFLRPYSMGVRYLLLQGLFLRSYWMSTKQNEQTKT